MKIFYSGRKGAFVAIIHFSICLKISCKNDKRKYQKIVTAILKFSAKIFRLFFRGVEIAWQLKMCLVVIVFHTLFATHFSSYEKNPLRDFLLLLVFANIHSNKFSWQLSITSQNERKETRVVTNDEAILAHCDPEKLLKFQEVQSTIETNENKFPARLNSCANVFTTFRDRDEILESSYSNRFANDLKYQNLDQCSTIANGGS